ATATTTVGAAVGAQADLAVTKVDTPDPVTAGTDLTYTITVTNNGPQDAQSVSLNETVPGGTSFVSFTPAAGWSCNAVSPGAGPGTGIACTFATLANGASAVFTLVVHVN